MSLGYWVRDLLHVWHRAATGRADESGRYLVRCLSLPIDVDRVGLFGAGALICDGCMKASEGEERTA